MVHRDNLLALLAVGFCRSILHEAYRIVDRDNIGNLKEGSLQDRIDPVSYTHLDVYKRQPIYEWFQD